MHDHICFYKEIKKELIGINFDCITLHLYSEVSKGKYINRSELRVAQS